MSYQRLIIEMLRVQVNGIPEGCPALKATQLHVPFNDPSAGFYADHGIPDSVAGFFCDSIFAAIDASVAA